MSSLNDSAASGGGVTKRTGNRDAFALAQLALHTECYREAEERLLEILAAIADAPRAPAASAAAPATPPRAGAAALLLAETYYQAGRYDDCLAHCRRAVERGWLKADDPQSELLAGWILLRRGLARPARALATRLLRATAPARGGDPVLHARLMHLRGMADFRLGRPRLARRVLRDATALFRAAGDHAGAAEALNMLGVIEKTAVSLPAAAARFAEALRLDNVHGRPGRRAQVLLNLAIVKLKMGETAAAEPLLREAQALQERRGGAQSLVRVRIALARARLQAGETVAAREEAAAALTAAVEQRFAREEGLALETLGDVARAEGHAPEARRYYERALALAEHGAPAGDLAVEVRRRLAELTLEAGDTEAAIGQLRLVIQAAAVCGEKFEEGAAQHALALACLESGQWSRAYRACRAALATLRDMGATLAAAGCLLTAARIRFAWWRATGAATGAELPAGDVPAAEAPADGGTLACSHLEAAWSYAIEGFHAFDGLGRDNERRECAGLMEEMRLAARGAGVPGAVPLPAAVRAEGEPRGTADVLVGSTPFVARSPAMRRLLELTAVAARSDEPVLVTGETGSGKELVARLVHQRSRRASGPFVPVNCAAIPESLFEREFFGHNRGAYTGADRDKPGLCETAHGGTLFLDEVGDLPSPVQAKLLRLLQEGTFRRLGDPAERHVDLRIVAATNADLADLIASRRFRQDLFYRLQTLELILPPLRERGEDVDALIDLFAARAAAGLAPGGGLGDPRRMFDAEVLDALRRYPWPGNVRELEAMVRRLALLAVHAGQATAAMLPPSIAPWRRRPLGVHRELSLAQHLAQAERERIAETLAVVEGNRAEAARRLGISRNALYKKMQRLNIRSPE